MATTTRGKFREWRLTCATQWLFSKLSIGQSASCKCELACTAVHASPESLVSGRAVTVDPFEMQLLKSLMWVLFFLFRYKNAALLSIWRYGEHCFTHGDHWRGSESSHFSGTNFLCALDRILTYRPIPINRQLAICWWSTLTDLSSHFAGRSKWKVVSRSGSR